MIETTHDAGKTPETATPPGTSLRRRRGRRLYSLANVKAALGDVYRRVEAGELDLPTARVLIYAASVLLGAIQGADIEARIAALESRQKGQP
jgi:hypothetical protein